MTKLHLPHISLNKYLCVVWLFLTSASPFIIYSWPWHPHKKIILVILCVMLIQLFKVRKIKLNVDYFAVSILLLFFNILLTIYFQSFVYIALAIQIISFIVLMTYINNFIGFNYFVKSFIYVMTAMAIGGTIIFWLHLLIGIPPLFSVNYGGDSHSYFLYLTCTNSYMNDGALRLLRYAGFFDDSGAFSLFYFYAI